MRSRLLVVALILVSGVGCRRPTATPPVTPIDRGMQRAVAWLIERQSSDGAWRSDTYGTFKDGPALTPVVLLALDGVPAALRPQRACERGIGYLSSFAHDGQIQEPEQGFDYPVYTAAMSLLVLPSGPARQAWLHYVQERQLTESLGWAPSDPEYGGWGYCRTLPKKPKPGEFAAPLTESNLSATRFAVEALRSAGVTADDPALARARQFIERCQNFAQVGGDPQFDDGGFFFMNNDPVRNKAGIRGTDASGRDRYASYGSTTGDGVRALRACGVALEDDRLSAARKWLDEHFDPTRVPGDYKPQHESLRPAVYFYYSASVTGALSIVGGPNGWREAWADELLSRQQPDGSWRNPADAMRENDEVAATAMALIAIGRLAAMAHP